MYSKNINDTFNYSISSWITTHLPYSKEKSSIPSLVQSQWAELELFTYSMAQSARQNQNSCPLTAVSLNLILEKSIFKYFAMCIGLIFFHKKFVRFSENCFCMVFGYFDFNKVFYWVC